MKWFSVFEGNLDVDKDALLRREVEATRNFLFGHIIWYDYELAFKAMLKGKQARSHFEFS